MVSFDISEEPNEINDVYTSSVVYKTTKDIISDIAFESEDDAIICDCIIDDLERDIADNVKNMKCAQIPFIGCIRINPVLKEISNKKLHLSTIRKSLTKEQYKEHVKSYVIDIKKRQSEKDKLNLIFYKIRRHNRKKYDYYCKRLGRNYAELFIKAIYWLKEVPFDAEWESKYQELKMKNNL